MKLLCHSYYQRVLGQIVLSVYRNKNTYILFHCGRNTDMCLSRACQCTQVSDSLTNLRAGGNIGRRDTQKLQVSFSFSSCAGIGPQLWQNQMLYSLLSYTFGEPVHHINMRKPLAAQFQQSSGTEGKATEPITNTQVCAPPESHLNFRKLQPGWKQKFQRFFSQGEKHSFFKEEALPCNYFKAPYPYFTP